MISGTAAWLLQRMRRNSSASGASAAGEATAEESADSAPGLPSFVGEMWVAHAAGSGLLVLHLSCISSLTYTKGLARARRMNSILHPTDAEDAVSDTSDAGKVDAERPPASWDTPYGGELGPAPQCHALCLHLHLSLRSHEGRFNGVCMGCTSGVLESEDTRVWEVLWKAGGGDGHLQRLTFEASPATRAFLHKQVESWSALTAQRCSDALRNGAVGEASRSSRPRLWLFECLVDAMPPLRR